MDIIKELWDQKIISTEDTAVIIYDLNQIEIRVKAIQEAFPQDTLHAIAIKANPLLSILKRLSNLGCGLEAASLPELKLAIEAGVPFDKIVFDSPAKTVSELKYALDNGIHINADSLQELERIDKLLKCTLSTSKIGLRINPQIGMGSINSTSVSGKLSKFGVPISTNKDKIICAYKQYSWLTGIHVHIGSQGYPVQKLVLGIKHVYELSIQINKELLHDNRKLEFFDIGGGLPVKYHSNDLEVTARDYVNLLRTEIPELFNGKLRLITEFGRHVHANAAIALSKVEYVKEEIDYNIIINHLGADFMLRKCYNPSDWHHKISVLDSAGSPKENSETKIYSIAGPLCFSGDFLDKNITLPKVEDGDFLVIQDVGAYTLSMWSNYNSREVPMVLGYDREKFEILKKRRIFEEVTNFWK